MTPFFMVSLPVPPSVNRRTVITRHGGYEHPRVTEYKWLCREPLRTALRDTDVLHTAQVSLSALAVQMVCCLTSTQFYQRDIDNMCQIPLNMLKVELDIDDVYIADLSIAKRLAHTDETPYLLISVATCEATTHQEGAINDARPHSSHTSDDNALTPPVASLEAAHSQLRETLLRPLPDARTRPARRVRSGRGGASSAARVSRKRIA